MYSTMYTCHTINMGDATLRFSIKVAFVPGTQSMNDGTRGCTFMVAVVATVVHVALAWPTECHCDNGTPKTVRCTPSVNAHDCGSCKAGYTIDNSNGYDICKKCPPGFSSPPNNYKVVDGGACVNATTLPPSTPPTPTPTPPLHPPTPLLPSAPPPPIYVVGQPTWPKECYCENGTPKTNRCAPSVNAHDCSTCKAGFILDASLGYQICKPCPAGFTSPDNNHDILGACVPK